MSIIREELSTLMHSRLPDTQDCIDVWQQQFAHGPELIYSPEGSPAQVGHRIEELIGLDLKDRLHYGRYIGSLSRDCCRFILDACGLDAEEIVSQIETPTYSRWVEFDPRTSEWQPVGVPRDVTKPPYTPPALEIKPEIIASPKIDAYERAALGGIARYLANSENGTKVCQALAEQSQGITHAEPAMLIAAWSAYIQRGQKQLTELGNPTHVSPHIIQDFAIADLIKGATVVDIKAYKNPSDAKLVAKAFHQVLFYALLDHDDSFGIRSIGVYQAYQGHLVSNGLDTVLAAASKGVTPTLSGLRDEMYERMQYVQRNYYQ